MNSPLGDKTFDDVNAGDRFDAGTRRITETDVTDFARLSGDYHPEHMDEEYARGSIHGERIAHGVLVLAIATGLVNQTGLFESSTIGVLEMKLKFLKAVKFNETVRTMVHILGKRKTSKPGRGIVTLGVTVVDTQAKPILEAEWTLMVKTGQSADIVT